MDSGTEGPGPEGVGVDGVEEHPHASVTGRPGFRKDLLEMVASVFIMSFGVVLSVKACLGATPIASFPNVLSSASGLSLGTTLFITYTAFVVIEWLLIRDRRRIVMTLSQLPFTFLFSLFVDLIEMALGFWTVEGDLLRWLLIAASVLVIGFGIVLEIDANVSMLADDGLVLAIHERTRVPVSKVMMLFDIAFVAAAFVLSYAVFHDFVGVGPGTIAAGVTLGLSVRLFTRVVKKYIRPDGNVESE